ncbi:MAG: DUF1573 domain-containing protein [Pirellulales bacterium]|nr:DUF1573 domain-containing protein [Pirellulales bacterium]
MLQNVTAAAGSMPTGVSIGEYNNCASTSLYCVAKLKSIAEIDYGQIKSKFSDTSNELHSIDEIKNAAQQIGLHPIAIKTDYQTLARLPGPLIVHLNKPINRSADTLRPHFVVVVAADASGVAIVDPPFAMRRFSANLFKERWTGACLAFASSKAEATDFLDVLSAKQRIPSVVNVLGLFTVLLVVVYLASKGTGIYGFTSRRIQAVAFITLGIASLFSLLLFRSSYPNQPSLALPGITANVGAFHSSKVACSVTLRNSGDATLEIKSVKSSCGCARPKFSNPVAIEPNEAAEISLELDVKPGQNWANLAIFSNDPKGPHQLSVSWTGTKKPLRINPSRIYMSDSPLGYPFTKTLEVFFPYSATKHPPSLTTFKSGIAGVTIREGEGIANVSSTLMSKDGRKAVYGTKNLFLEIEPPKIAGKITGEIALEILHDQTSTDIRLPIDLNFINAVQTVPPEGLVFVASNSEQDTFTQQKTLKILLPLSMKQCAVEILEIPDWLLLAEQSGSGQERIFNISRQNIPELAFSTGQIKLKVMTKPELLFEVPVYLAK